MEAAVCHGFAAPKMKRDVSAARIQSRLVLEVPEEESTQIGFPMVLAEHQRSSDQYQEVLYGVHQRELIWEISAIVVSISISISDSSGVFTLQPSQPKSTI